MDAQSLSDQQSYHGAGTNGAAVAVAEEHAVAVLEEHAVALQEADRPLPLQPFPILPLLSVSGLYQWTQSIVLPHPIPIPTPIPVPIPGPGASPASDADTDVDTAIAFGREELRLDVDGRYPQNVVSGTIFLGLTERVHWIARLTPQGANTWTGRIFYKNGNVASFTYSKVTVKATSSLFLQKKATVTFSGGGIADRVRTYTFVSTAYRPVDFEFDFAQGTSAVTSYPSHAHPNRPASLPNENLTLQKVFQRAGFAVTTSAGGQVPLSGAGANARWSDAEMHDAMQVYWSHFAAKAQWSLWTFFASLHEQGTSLGGIMFDDIGPNHRQGTAIFNDSFISVAPNGDPAPGAWVDRMRFWTAIHEMGHSFNLAHAWQKSLGTAWIPLTDEPESRSPMNYPYGVAGGQTAFFSSFEYRFSDSELLFMRHAPARFVRMGDAAWFDHHGFEQANVSAEPALKLELRVNRDRHTYEFMEPVTVELKLTNVSDEPVLIPENLLQTLDRMTIVTKKDGTPAKQFAPYAQYCWRGPNTVLAPKESTYESVFISAGQGGWDLAEPGYYTVQVALHMPNEDLVSNQLRLRVAPPMGYDEEYVAQDFFSEDVGRIMTFDGSRVLGSGNDTLQEVAARLSDRRVALHAQVALGAPLAHEYKVLDVGRAGRMPAMSAAAAGGAIACYGPDKSQAHQALQAALVAAPTVAAESLGHIDFKYYTDRFAKWMASEGETEQAAEAQDRMLDALSQRNVLDRVLREIEHARDAYRDADEGGRPSKKAKSKG